MTQQLHIASFNAENFYLLLDGEYSSEELDALDEKIYFAMNSSIYNPNKDRAKIAEIAKIIIENDFDLVGLCEVGGLQILEAFLTADCNLQCACVVSFQSFGVFSASSTLARACFGGLLHRTRPVCLSTFGS